MDPIQTDNLRCVALVGHAAVGKTTLAEALLHASGATTSRGSVDRGNTVCDYDPQEKEWGHSLQSALLAIKAQVPGATQQALVAAYAGTRRADD